MRERHHELATTMTREGGKPFCENYDEVEWSAACFDYYAEVGKRLARQLDPAGGAAPGQLHDQGALRRRRRHRAVELPAAVAVVEGRAGARGRQYGDRQAVRGDAARDARPRCRFRGSAARHGQYRQRPRRRGRRGAGQPSGRRSRGAHRLARHWPAGRRALRAGDQEVPSRARRQRSVHRLPRRRSRSRGARRRLGGLPERRPGLHQRQALLRLRRRSTTSSWRVR